MAMYVYKDSQRTIQFFAEDALKQDGHTLLQFTKTLLFRDIKVSLDRG